MDIVLLDFETRSRTDLAKAGAYKYASCPTTGILCMSAIDHTTGDEWLWYPDTQPFPASLRRALQQADLVAAVNAEFDKGIWEFIAAPDHGAPRLSPDVWYCIAAQCRVNAMPSSLENAARALGITKRKDPRGKQLIKALSIPDPKTGEFTESPVLLKEMGAYCLQDSRLARQVMGLTRMMSATEHKDWLITCGINEKGAKVDVELARLAVTYADAERGEIAKQLTELTGGKITKHTQAVRIRNWLLDECDNDPEVRALMTVKKGDVEKLSLDKDVRATLLEAQNKSGYLLCQLTADVLELVDLGSKSSVSKFQRMLDMAEDDDRVRGAFVFAGAGQTQRFASRGLQLHNMRRDCWGAEETKSLKGNMAKRIELANVMESLSKLLRPALIPAPGHSYVVSDWSAIEGRVLPWLTNDPRTESVLDVFRSGADIYIATAKGMGITDRQIGKVATLALGYQGAVGAFQAMAKNYGLILSESEVLKIVFKWRDANPWAVDYWRACEKAALKAMRHPGAMVEIGKCHFMFVAGLMGGTLCGILPDGTVLQYPNARLDYVKGKYGGKWQVSYAKASVLPKADAKEWPRHSLYGGLIAENFSQGTAGAILKHSLRELEKVCAPVAFHVHDEIIEEVPFAEVESRSRQLQTIMETPPVWAAGLPLQAKPSVMARYGK